MSSEDSPEASASSAPSSPGAESEPSAESGAQSEAEAEVGSTSGAESEPSAESGAQSEAEAEVGSTSGAESEPSAESGAQSEAEVEVDPTSGAESEPSAESGAQSMVSSDTEKESEKEAGSEATAASATKKKIQKHTGKAEKFEANPFGTLEEHVASHDYPAHVAKCGPCKFWRNRWQWSAQFSCINPVSQKKETWLGCKNGFAICLICAAHKGSASSTQLGKGIGSFLKKSNIQRHGERCDEHASAVQAWQQRLRAEATQVETISICTVTSATSTSATVASATVASATAASAKDKAASIRTRQPTTGYRAVVAARALLETSGSFHSFDVWLHALGGEERQALESPWHCKRLVSTMAHYEKELTHRMLIEGAVFRLQADGLERTYQVEIGTLLWSLPSFLKHLPTHGEQAGWLEVLGPRGPWLVERIVGMQEFPHGMDCDGKVSMLEACVRRACISANGEVDTKLHQHVREQTRVWCSDGADLQVPLAASAFFPGLVFHAWDEAHSAQRLCANAMKDADEITRTDELLVTGKKPYSLAKFLSTSMVFRKTVGDAQHANEIAFVKNFGWAPQRFNSRARPYARESRRWEIIFDAVAKEAAGDNRDRRILARMYLKELGGENSARLVLAGLLADLSAEHYTWVATGDKQNPDATTVQSRADAFLARLNTLFNAGLILTLPDTYTGVTLKFLKKTHYYRFGNSVQTIGIGDWKKDESARKIIKEALGRVRVAVENMTEYMKLYRPKHSWLHAFTAFRLPSPLSASDEAGGAARAEVNASLRRICQEAKLPEKRACSELLQLLPRAERHHLNGCHPRAAWGRAAAEWPEFQSARRLVELFLIWKTASGNLERRFRRFREIRCPERAKLLDVSVENCMLVEQAPPSKMLRTLQSSFSDARASLHQADKNNYFQHVLKLHEKLHGNGPTRIRRVERRDAGASREPASGRLGPETEAAFGRKREAAIADAAAASLSKRARMIRNAPLGLSRVAQEAAEESVQNPAAASAAVVAKVAKRHGAAKERNLRGAEAAAKARAQREQKVAQSSTQTRQGRDEHLAPARKPGIMLVRLQDGEARRKAQQLRFQLTSDPLDFVAKVALVPASTRKGHVVLAPPVDTDYSLSAMIAAALMGGFYATPKDFLKQDESPRGIMYTEKYKSSKQSFHVAVSAKLADELPTLPQLLRAIALAPGSSFKLYLCERKLCRFFKKTVKTTPRIGQRTFVLAKQGDGDTVKKEFRGLYISPRSFLLRFQASERAVCPGC